jgi:hypothetical protein
MSAAVTTSSMTLTNEPLDDEEWVAIENELPDLDGPKPKKRKLTLNVKCSAAGMSISKGGCG